MEPMSTPSAEAVNAELSSLRAIHLQLQDTVARLRTELENAAAVGRANVQATETQFANQLAELRKTIDSLRRNLEDTAAQGRAETQAEKARGASEAKQLRDTIDSMRIEMLVAVPAFIVWSSIANARSRQTSWSVRIPIKMPNASCVPTAASP